MTKDVTVAELTEHLSEVIEDVRQGITIRLVEEGRPIAKIAPAVRGLDGPWIDINGLRVRPGKGSMRDVQLPPPLKPEIDILKYLDEERGDR